MTHSIDTESIPRSPRKLSRDTFEILFKLMMKQPWLERRQDGLFEVLEGCSNLDEQSLICDLLSRFTYISPERLNNDLRKIANQIVDIWHLLPTKTKIVAINRSSYSDSSQSILWHLKPVMADLEGWATINFVDKMSDAVDLTEADHNIVLVDEFSGTGETMKKAVSWFKKKLLEANKEAHLFACSLAAMEASKSRIDAEDVDFFAVNWLRRGISDHYATGQVSAELDRMLRLESDLASTIDSRPLSKYSLGYGKSESLYYLENGNLPNNVFPIFWWPELKNKAKRKTILRRLQ